VGGKSSEETRKKVVACARIPDSPTKKIPMTKRAQREQKETKDRGKKDSFALSCEKMGERKGNRGAATKTTDHRPAG